jgi:hypothetical protein
MMPNENILADDFARATPVPAHILQAMAEKVAGALWQRIRGACPVTIIAFYGDSVRADGTAFVTTLTLNDLVSTVEASVVQLEHEGSVPLGTDPEAWLPDLRQAAEMAQLCRDALPFSVCFALIFGRGHDQSYSSYVSREAMLHHLSKVALPHFRARQAVAPFPESA